LAKKRKTIMMHASEIAVFPPMELKEGRYGGEPLDLSPGANCEMHIESTARTHTKGGMKLCEHYPGWFDLKLCRKCKQSKCIMHCFGNYKTGINKTRIQLYCKECRWKASVKTRYVKAYPNDKANRKRSIEFMRTKLMRKANANIGN
jgi:hypothetical protein